MSITAVKYAAASDLKGLQAAVADLLADDYTPFGAPTEINGLYVQTMVLGAVDGTYQDLSEQIESLTEWTGDLTDKLNATFTTANAAVDFPLALDTDFAPAA